MDIGTNALTDELLEGPTADDLAIKIFADGADLATFEAMAADPQIKGFTTNPTLMNKGGVTDYEAFAKSALEIIGEAPISLEVFSDDIEDMGRQARILASWGENVYVKIPVTNTEGTSTADLVRSLTNDGVKVNVTGLFTLAQVREVTGVLEGGAPANISVFAGRIADAGVDPIPVMTQSLEIMASEPQIELIWASPREVLNMVQADAIGCHIITVTHDLLAKRSSLGKDLTSSRERRSRCSARMRWRPATSFSPCFFGSAPGAGSLSAMAIAPDNLRRAS